MGHGAKAGGLPAARADGRCAATCLLSQIYTGMDDDEFFAHEGDLDAAQDLVTLVGHEHGELFTYPGSSHLYVDSSLPTYDAEATALTLQRSRAALDRFGGP